MGPILLVRLAGTPFSLRDLRPDTELMLRAAALRATGTNTSAIDLANFESLEMLYPQALQSDAYEWALRQPRESMPALFVEHSPHQFALPARLKKHQSGIYERLGEQLVAKVEPAAVCFKIVDRKDLAPTLLALRRVRAMRPRTRIFGFGPGFADETVLSRGLRAFDAVMLGPDLPVAELCSASDRRDWRAIPNLTFYDSARLTITRKDLDTDFLPDAAKLKEKILYTAVTKYSKMRVFDVFAVQSGADSSSMELNKEFADDSRLAAIKSLSEVFDSRTFCLRGERGQCPRSVERELLSAGLRVTYSSELDPADTARTRLGVLSASGCVAADLAIHTGSQRLLDNYYSRNFTVTQVERLVRAARFAGVFASTHFTFPCSEDDYHTEDETLRLVRRSNPGSAVVSYLPGQDTPESGLLALEFGPLRRRARARARRQSAELENKIREINITVGVDAPTALVANLAGYRGRESAFVEVTALQLLSGDTTGLAETIEQVNDAARRPAQSAAFRPLTLIQNAAAN